MNWSDHVVSLSAVFSPPAGEMPAGIDLPPGWSLMWHQAETFRALNDPEIDVVINTAMTGDGKSLAAYLGQLCPEQCQLRGAIGLYPTNELARDQERQMADYRDRFHATDLRVVQLSSESLELYAEQEQLRKGDAIASKTSNADIVLSNPDIFHYLHRGSYLIPQKQNSDKLWNRIDKDFDLFIFDEFHIFQAPQVAGVLNTMLLIRHTNRNKKFLFLSATPDAMLIEMLERAGFRYRVIDPRAADRYQFPATGVEEEALRSHHWRCVVRPINLMFIPLESVAQASEQWLANHVQEIAELFGNHPHSKGAIILNAIAAVKRLVPKFKAIFEPLGLTVGENTGLSGRTVKQDSLNCDLVIGTSTIDIGVDFKINLLWFESADAGNFIQRLGRLGRHEANRQGQPFDQFLAFALSPQFLVDRLFAQDQPLSLVKQTTVNRLDFHDLIYQNYRNINDFRGYYSRWGAIQTFKIWAALGQLAIADQYPQSRENLENAIKQVFGTSIKRAAGATFAWAKEWQETFSKKQGNPIAEEACSFRGSSPLLCGIYDATEPHLADRFKTYDLPGILSNLAIETWTESHFMRTLADTSQHLETPIAKGRFRHCLGFMQLTGYREERLDWRFSYGEDLAAIAHAWRVVVLAGLQVWQPENRWITEINRVLRSRAIVAYVLPRSVLEVRQRLQLPMHFPIYPLVDPSSMHEKTPPYAIAIGQAALLIDTLAARLKSRGDELWIA